MLVAKILGWGLLAGTAHIAAMALLYGRPSVARLRPPTGGGGAGVGSGGRGLAVRLLGSQVEVYVMTVGYLWLHPLLPVGGLLGAVGLAGLFAALRVCAPVWALWARGAYSRGYLTVEVAAGVLGSLVVVLTLWTLD
ncbi:hypothetical protein D5S18_05950 [Nocardia panacis]|uniref:Uncharacterized protein n=1 Tax=Nocardia panacis TaxID=2340916 RepID=A0A3A4K1W0_9NOCA|nr:hypothetical protein [Nocardia panacis]RJO78428.1 hypothetical protein D5S18_05950 [Nocardia panacis]